MSTRRCAALLWAASMALVSAGPAAAHGLVGQRFFPATLTIDDPFVADELSLPTVSTFACPATGRRTTSPRSRPT